MQNRKKIIEPYVLDGYLIIALHPDWIKLYNGIPKFSMEIDEQCRLHLVANEVT